MLILCEHRSRTILLCRLSDSVLDFIQLARSLRCLCRKSSPSSSLADLPISSPACPLFPIPYLFCQPRPCRGHRSPSPFLTSLPHYLLTSSALSPFLATHPKIRP